MFRQWLTRPFLPKIAPDNILEGAEEIKVCAPASIDGNIELKELVVICAVIQKYRPRKLFEFGTFNGRTTLNMAVNSPPEATVYTLDLPTAFTGETGLPLDKNDASYIGKNHRKRFIGTPFEKKIVSLYGDSAHYDFTPFYGQMDFVFVDASHGFRYVMNDSLQAVRLLKRGTGFVFWHDYSHWPGVTRSLNYLYRKTATFAGLKHIQGTTLAFLFNTWSALQTYYGKQQ